MKSTNSQTTERAGNSDLDSRYGEIGISAVVAALRYKSDTKAAAEAPAKQLDEKWLADIAA
jgi:hypothetical protein